ncbi:MAG: glycosyltransferase [Candidatus Micrarchaeaceae archaeon]
MEFEDLTFVLPTLNEAGNVSEIAKKLLNMYKGASIIFADDGSKDGTIEEIKRLEKSNKVLLLDRSDNNVHGLTASVIDGIMHSSTPYAIVMDADMQHPIEKAAELHKKLSEGFNIVVATRTSFGSMPVFRRLVSRCTILFAIFIFKLRKKKTVSDMTSGFFGVNTNFFKSVVKGNENRFVLRGYKVLIDLLRISGSKAKIAEIEYSSLNKRKYGKSKANIRHMAEALLSILKH